MAWKSAETRNAQRFTESSRQAQRAQDEREKSRLLVAEHVAKLRNLRLAKEAADKEAAKNAPPKKKKAAAVRKAEG